MQDRREKHWADFLESIKDLSEEERAVEVRLYFTSTDSPDDFCDEDNPSMYYNYIEYENRGLEMVEKEWAELQYSIKQLTPEERRNEEIRWLSNGNR